jgi:hypothetical protein
MVFVTGLKTYTNMAIGIAQDGDTILNFNFYANEWFRNE